MAKCGADLRTHGTSKAYNNGCRCSKARKAHREYQREARASRRERLAAGAVIRSHGTETGYVEWGCRCPDCTSAHAAAWLARWRRDRDAA